MASTSVTPSNKLIPPVLVQIWLPSISYNNRLLDLFLENTPVPIFYSTGAKTLPKCGGTLHSCETCHQPWAILTYALQKPFKLVFHVNH